MGDQPADALDRGNRTVAPAPDGLSHQRDEGHAHGSACLRMRGHLSLLSHGEGMPLGGGSSSDSELLHSGNDSYVQGSRLASKPDGQVHVSRAAAGAGNQRGYLLPGRKCCRLGSREECVPEGVVAVDAVTISPAANLMVPKRISSGLADRASSPLLRHPQAQPVLETEPKLPVMKVQTESMTGDHVEPVTSMGDGRREGQSLGAGVRGRGTELIKDSLVDTL